MARLARPEFFPVGSNQGGQIGRIFTHGVIIDFGKFFLITEVAQTTQSTFLHIKSYVFFVTKTHLARIPF
jgi:hypothetical protein